MRLRGRPKQESTVAPSGLMTPAQSTSDQSNGTPSIKDEELIFTHTLQGVHLESSRHGLDVEDEGYGTKDRRHRSDTISLGSSRNLNHYPNPYSRTTVPGSTMDSGLKVVGGPKVKLIVDATNDLRQFGLDHVVRLPALVLVGDQSAGKSSLMGALTEVRLPRSQGMCTRCPANIKTSPADTWSCKVSLHLYYKYNAKPGQKIAPHHVTSTNPFPPWIPQPLVVKPFKTITDSVDLEEVIRCAQKALLNYNTNYLSFLPGYPENHDGESKEPEALFSPNIISIEISGPGLLSLSFYDLPGIIQVAPREDHQYLEKIIKNLAKKYIEEEKAIIIWALTMKSDPSTSSTGKLISDLRAKDRSMGVLTMPDVLQNRHKDFEEILHGRAHVLGHGYFVTKQPGPDSLIEDTHYHAIAREEEESFFNSNELWTGPWASFKGRCGSVRIQQFLSQLLAKHIAKDIPEINIKIQEATQKVEEELSRLPDVPNDKVQHIVRHRLNRFSNEVRSMLDGNTISQRNSFQSNWKKLCYNFRFVIMEMRPGLRCVHESDKAVEIINLDEDEDEDGDLVPPTPTRAPYNDRKHKHPNPDAETPPPKRPQSNNPLATPVRMGLAASSIDRHRPQTPGSDATIKGGVKSKQGTIGPKIQFPFDEPYALRGRGAMSIGDLRQSIEEHSRAGVPEFVNQKVMEGYVLKSITFWDMPLKTLVQHTVKMLREEISSILRDILEGYTDRELYRRSQPIIDDFLDDLENDQCKTSLEFYETERYNLYTINDDAFAQSKAEALKTLKAQRRINRVNCYIDKQSRQGFLKLRDNNEGREELKKKVTDEKLGPDPFENEMAVAAYIRAYYALASQRFVDCVCSNINANLFRKIIDKIEYLIETKLELDVGDSEKICREFLSEDPTVGHRRVELQNERASLIGFAQRLAQLEREAYEVDESDRPPVDMMAASHPGGYRNDGSMQSTVGGVYPSEDPGI
ncbi:hypothetical protein B7494_g4672 [Chlorociboria aeruginascens]|nr:hypothetical protein B7494_g4672 [Chlorociboria aeruginascens]